MDDINRVSARTHMEKQYIPPHSTQGCYHRLCHARQRRNHRRYACVIGGMHVYDYGRVVTSRMMVSTCVCPAVPVRHYVIPHATRRTGLSGGRQHNHRHIPYVARNSAAQRRHRRKSPRRRSRGGHGGGSAWRRGRGGGGGSGYAAAHANGAAPCHDCGGVLEATAVIGLSAATCAIVRTGTRTR